MTQAEAAAAVGLKPVQLSNRLNGKSNFTLSEIQRFSKLFGKSVDELFPENMWSYFFTQITDKLAIKHTEIGKEMKKMPTYQITMDGDMDELEKAIALIKSLKVVKIDVSAKAKKDKPVKHRHGSLNNVLLTDAEYAKLQWEFKNHDEKIENLSLYLGSTGKKYESHYITLLNWERKAKTKEQKKVVADF